MEGGKLILIVDDESSIRDITGQILQSYGYRVATAVDGTAALVQFVERRDEIGLVLTDMVMPYMDGAATIRAIRNIDPRVPIVATSGLMLNEHARQAKSLGVQAFLAKPYTAETLLQTIGKVIGHPSFGSGDGTWTI